MQIISYRRATIADIPAMARIHNKMEEGGASEERMTKYLTGQRHPQQALEPRVGYVAYQGETCIGFIAGHLTCRYDCEGELQWIYVVSEYRGNGVASALLKYLADWFLQQNASRICVNVAPDNATAQRFYARHGANRLNEYWLVWDNISLMFK